MTFFAEIDGHPCTRVTWHVPQRGAWYALCDTQVDPKLKGRVTLKLDTLTLSGTVVPTQAGDSGDERRLTIAAGAGGWGATIRPVAYHNDAGVRVRLVAEDLARAVGETLGTFQPESEFIGSVDYVIGGPRVASLLLEDVIGDVLWWVDNAGVTQVAANHALAIPASVMLEAQRERERAADRAFEAGGELVEDVQVLDYDPRAKIASLSVVDLSVLRIGLKLVSGLLPAPQFITEYEVQADAAGYRVLAWCGGDRRSAGRLSELWHRVTARILPTPLFGLYRYRVIRMAGTRVDLQSVSKAAGVPDLATITQWPGAPGIITAKLSAGALVLVQFIEGDRSMPIVTHYTGPNDAMVPVELTLAAAGGVTVQGDLHVTGVVHALDFVAPVPPSPAVSYVTHVHPTKTSPPTGPGQEDAAP